MRKLFFVAFIPRLMLMPWAASLPLAGDEKFYWRTVAQQVASGELLSYAQQLRPPLWGCVLAVPAYFSPNPAWGRLLTVFLSAFTIAMIYRLAAEIFDEKTAYVTALLLALFPEHIFFSHYLWAETAFCLAAVTTTWLFFKALKEPGGRNLALPFIFCGISCLVKEYAVLLFTAMLVLTAMVLPPQKRARKMALYSLLFILPAGLYSLICWRMTGQLSLISRAWVGNVNQNITGRFDKDTNIDDADSVLEKYMARTPPQHIENTWKQIVRLWSANSFPVHRLLTNTSEWRFDIPGRKLLAYVSAAAYTVVILLGLAGLVTSSNRLFWLFSIITFSTLTLSGAFALLVSRYRLPFMYIWILNAAYLLTHWNQAIIKLRFSRTKFALALLWMLFGVVVAKGFSNFGNWG